jgi:hypothetical protein
MPSSKTAIIFLVFVLMLSVFVANIANLIDVGGNAHVPVASRGINDVQSNADQRTANNLSIGKSSEHLMWFIQVCAIKS